MVSDESTEEMMGRLYNEAMARIRELETENRDWRMGKLHSPVPHLDDVRRLSAEVEELRQRNITIAQTSGVAIGRAEAERDEWRKKYEWFSIHVKSGEVMEVHRAEKNAENLLRISRRLRTERDRYREVVEVASRIQLGFDDDLVRLRNAAIRALDEAKP